MCALEIRGQHFVPMLVIGAEGVKLNLQMCDPREQISLDETRENLILLAFYIQFHKVDIARRQFVDYSGYVAKLHCCEWPRQVGAGAVALDVNASTAISV